MAQRGQSDTRQAIVRELLKDPGRAAAEITAEFAARGAAVNEATVEQLREIVAIVLQEQARESRRILRARPVEGEIDYAELSREHMARYPKIRAALAK